MPSRPRIPECWWGHATLLVGLLLLLPIAATGASEKPKVRATIEELFRDPMYRRAIISPGGRYVAAEYFDDERTKVSVSDMDAGVDSNVLTIYEDSRDAWIPQLLWADDDSLLITVDQRRPKSGGRRERVTYVVDLRSGENGLERDFHEIAVRGLVVDPLPAVEDSILFSPTSEGSSVYRISLAGLPRYEYTGADVEREESASFSKDALVAQLGDTVVNWISDADGAVRCALAYAEDPVELRIWYRSDAGAAWQLVYAQQDPRHFEDLVPLGLSEDGQRLVVATNRDRDRYGLYDFDPAARALGDLLYEHPSGELVNVIYDYSRSKILGAMYLEAGEVRYAYLQSEAKSRNEILARAFPNHTVRVTSTSADGRRLALLASSPQDPGIFYYFDLDSNRAREIGRMAPWLENNVLAAVRSFKVKAQDGPEVEAFLAYPPLTEGRAPLVVMPHGGPAGMLDMREFNPEVQYLARSGFAVLQVNYRGSGGYGREFERAGYRQWGRGIENDIDAAVEYVIEQGWVDREHMCVVGASYGGYSALMSVIRHPTRYRCAATFAGVTDIALMFNSSDWSWSEVSREQATEIIGDPDHEYEQLREYSPVYHVSEIQVPIFVAHGIDDRRVDVDHAYRLLAMLELYGLPFRWRLLENTGHGFNSTSDAIHYYIELREFLSEYLSD
jgi:dienelactone hydrolase